MNALGSFSERYSFLERASLLFASVSAKWGVEWTQSVERKSSACNQLQHARCVLIEPRPRQRGRSHLPLRFIRLRLRPPVAFIDAGSVSRSAFRLASWIDSEKELLRACRSASFAICSNFSSTADTFLEMAGIGHGMQVDWYHRG